MISTIESQIADAGHEVLVTGATSFVGWAIVRELRSVGIPVAALVRRPSQAASQLLTGVGIRLIIGDLANPEVLSKETSGFRAVVHAAATARLNERGLRGLISDNVIASMELIDFAHRVNCPSVIGLSTVSVHGCIDGGRINAETGIRDPETYGMSKRLSEEILLSMASNEMSVTLLRLPGVLGVGADHVWMSFVVKALLRGDPIPVHSAGTLFNNAVHRNYLAEFVASLCMLGKPASGVYPLGSSQPERLGELLEAMAEECRSESVFIEATGIAKPFWIDDSAARANLDYRSPTTREVLLRYVREMTYAIAAE